MEERSARQGVRPDLLIQKLRQPFSRRRTIIERQLIEDVARVFQKFGILEDCANFNDPDIQELIESIDKKPFQQGWKESNPR